MIYIKDDFLDDSLIELLNADKDEFQEVKTPGKSFWVKEVPKPVMDIIKFEIEQGIDIVTFGDLIEYSVKINNIRTKILSYVEQKQLRTESREHSVRFENRSENFNSENTGVEA